MRSKPRRLTILTSISLAVLISSGAPVLAEGGKEVKALVEGNSAFALDLYARLGRGQGNLFLSPYSVSTALAMTYAGARGNTAKQMSDTLRFTLDPSRLHRAFGDLQEGLNAYGKKGDIELRVANGLWAQKNYQFLDRFVELVKRHYFAELGHADFKHAAESVRKEINGWVERQTNQRIKDLLKPGVLDPLTRLVLINAIYFKGLWVEQFKAERTKEMPFWTSSARKTAVPMMHQKNDFKYMGDDALQILELPYVHQDLSMIVLLPKEIDGLEHLERSLSPERLNSWMSHLRKRRVEVYLPRFKMSSQFSLGRILAAMGMPDAFSFRAADFSGMDGTRDLFISEVVHKAFVEVNEEGSEAAAATGVTVRVTSVEISTPVFRADHPFVLLIRENTSGSILFLGRLVDPGS